MRKQVLHFQIMLCFLHVFHYSRLGLKCRYLECRVVLSIPLVPKGTSGGGMSDVTSDIAVHVYIPDT